MAYFLQKRCTAYGGITEGEKQAHCCDFSSVVACELLTPEMARMVLACVEYKLIAEKRECQSISPRVCIHVISLTRILSACYSVIDALWCSLLIVNPHSLHQAMQCPTFMKSLAVDIMSLPLTIHFCGDHVLAQHFNYEQIVAIVDILFMVDE